jgi:hypothetical protein
MQLVTDSREPFTDNTTSLLVSPSPLLACTSLGCILIAGVAFYHGRTLFSFGLVPGCFVQTQCGIATISRVASDTDLS